MTTRVVSVTAETAPGQTVTVHGHAYLVLHLLPQVSGRPLTARVTREPPCRLCEASLVWRPGGWACSGCHDSPDAETLAAWAAEHVADGARGADRWRAEIGFPAGVLPTDADFHDAAHVGDWRRAELLARIALQDGHRLSDAARRGAARRE